MPKPTIATPWSSDLGLQRMLNGLATPMIQLHWAGIDTNGQGAILHECCRNLILIGADLHPILDKRFLFGLGGLARPTTCRVGVVCLGFQADLVLDHVLVCIAGKATLATLVTSLLIAVNELLLTQGNQLIVLHKTCALDVCNCCESPAT